MSDVKKNKIYCNRCRQTTDHTVLKEIQKHFTPDENPDMQIDFADGKWEILECCGCQSIVFRETWITSEDIDSDGLRPTVTLYPSRDKDLLELKSFWEVPAALRQIYMEMITSYNNQCCILCAGGIRGLIEGICIEKNIQDGPVVKIKNGISTTVRGNNLYAKIEGLAEKGILTKEHSRILHENRVLGNDALHTLQDVPKEDLKIAIEIIEHTLENLYEIQVKGQLLALKNRHRKGKF